MMSHISVEGIILHSTCLKSFYGTSETMVARLAITNDVRSTGTVYRYIQFCVERNQRIIFYSLFYLTLEIQLFPQKNTYIIPVPQHTNSPTLINVAKHRPKGGGCDINFLTFK